MRTGVSEQLVVQAPAGWAACQVTAVRGISGTVTGYDSAGHALVYPVNTTAIPDTRSFLTPAIKLLSAGKYVLQLRETVSGESFETVLRVTDSGGSSSDSEGPLSPDEQARIRMYCGYSALYRQTFYILDGAMKTVSSDTSALSLIRGMLDDLADIDAQLKDARGRLKVDQVDEVKIRARDEVKDLRMEGGRMVERLATLLAVPVQRNAFGSSGGIGSGMTRRG